MARVGASIVLAAALGNCCFILPAQAAEPAPSRHFSATLLGGYRFGGALQDSRTVTGSGGTTTEELFDVHLEKGAMYGLAINWDAEPDSFYEVAYSRQTTQLDATSPIDMTVEYLHIGGFVTFAEPTAHVIPYFRLTVGAARFSPDRSDLETLVKPSAAIGGGVIVPFTQHLSMRFDGRLNAAFFQGQQEVFCRSSGTTTCSIHLQGGTLIQPELSVGFTFGF